MNTAVFITPGVTIYCSQEIIPKLSVMYTNTVIALKQFRRRNRVNKQGQVTVSVYKVPGKCGQFADGKLSLLENKECLVFLLVSFLVRCSLH